MFLVGYLLISLMFLAGGICLLLSPGTYFTLLDRMAGTDFWSKSGPAWDPKAPKWLALGLALTLFALFMIFGPPLSVYLRSPEEFNQRFRSSHHNVSWEAVVLWLFFSVLGIGFFSKPLVLVDAFSPRKLSGEPDAQRHLYKLRIFGGIVFFISLFGLSVQLLRYLLR